MVDFERLRRLGRTLRRNPGYIVLGVIIILAVVEFIRPLTVRPTYSHELNIQSEGIRLVWQQPGWIGLSPPAIDSHAVYFTEGNPEGLVALDKSSGRRLWENRTSRVIFGARRVLTDDDRVYIVTYVDAVAFSLTTGQWLWATKLGGGHVRIIADLAPGILRIYYGTSEIRLARDSGQLITSQPLGDVQWIVDDIAIRVDPSGLAAIDRATRTQLWESDAEPFEAYGDFPPARGLPGQLLVVVKDRTLCALSLDSGSYDWCAPVDYASNIVVDSSQRVAFLLDQDWDLISVDLGTGALTTAASFPATRPPPTSLEHAEYRYRLAINDHELLVYFPDTGELFLLQLADL